MAPRGRHLIRLGRIGCKAAATVCLHSNFFCWGRAWSMLASFFCYYEHFILQKLAFRWSHGAAACCIQSNETTSIFCKRESICHNHYWHAVYRVWKSQIKWLFGSWDWRVNYCCILICEVGRPHIFYMLMYSSVSGRSLDQTKCFKEYTVLE